MVRKLHYFLIYKPYKVLSQFTDEDGNSGLGSLFDLPRDVYPVGRLDLDSEGLLILSNDRKLNQLLLDPKHGHEREYWVQVEGQPSDAALKILEKGPAINLKGKQYKTKPSKVIKLEHIDLPERDPPVSKKKYSNTCWLSLSLTEGKNRQVRRMTAAAGHPTLRLVRVAIGGISLQPLKPGEIRQISRGVLYRKLGIED